MGVKLKQECCPLYKNKHFSHFYPFVGIYSLVTGVATFMLKPFRLLQNASLRQEDCFLIPKSGEGERHIALVTGANTGIGLETAASLVERGYDVILGCRSRDKGESAVRLINERINNTPSKSSSCGNAIFLHPLDLSSLDSVRSFAEVFAEKYSSLNILVNNAGMNSTGKSIDGLDLCFQTNFVGHYLLTRILLPLLLKAKNLTRNSSAEIKQQSGRVVNLSSVTHHFARADEERDSGQQRDSDQGTGTCCEATGIHDAKWWKGCATPEISDNTYKESKLAAIIFTNELNRRYGSDGLRAVAVNPGAVNSDIWRTFPKFSFGNAVRHLYLTSKQGSSTSVAAAIGNLPSGAVYLQPYWLPQSNTISAIDGQKSSFSRWYKCPYPVFEMMGPYIGHAVTDPRLPADEITSAAALWDVCEDLVAYNKTQPAI